VKNSTINIVLVSGMIAGILMASFSIVNRINFGSDGQWVAKIEATEISKSKYLLQLDGLAADRRSPLSLDDKKFVLERMIEEELLIQRALDMGMLKNNAMARGTIVQQMINSIISDNSMIPVEDRELLTFFEKNKGFFTSAKRLHVKQIYFSDSKGSSAERSSAAYEDLIQNRDFKRAEELGDSTALEIPQTLMTLSKVREYLGPSLMQLAESMQTGEFSKPQMIGGGHKIIYLVDREDAFPPDFETIKEQVLSEFKKRRDDSSLREYLDNLKNWYDVKRNLST
jgi:hypothetical protein